MDLNVEAYVKYLPDYKLVICIDCKVALVPPFIKRHFRERHANSIDLCSLLSTADELKDLWASPKRKDQLRKRNRRLELIPSYAQNTDILDQYLQDDTEVELEEMDLEVNGPIVSKNPKRKHQIFEEIVVEPMPKRRSK